MAYISPRSLEESVVLFQNKCGKVIEGTG